MPPQFGASASGTQAAAYEHAWGQIEDVGVGQTHRAGHILRGRGANEKRDTHILSADFLDGTKFPTATFKSKSWKKTGESTFDVTGDLKIKDVTKEVVLHVTLNGFAPGKPGTTVSGWEATTVIKKSDFGVAGPAGLTKILGDEVTLNISIEAGYSKA